ncbi:hypothetical protein CK219_16230 [Mesorhizobium sp. WSM4313]|nr:hypothetical protein CK219_16230 [Mesorhizobium sp. WSM4313]
MSEAAIWKFEHMAEIGIGAAHYIAERYEEALLMTQRGISRQPGATWALRWLVTTLVYAGRKDEAQRVCGRLLESHPELTVAAIRNQLPFEAGSGSASPGVPRD